MKAALFVLLFSANAQAEICKWIDKYSKEYKINPKVIESIIAVESSFRTKVIGDDGKSFGLMQVQFPTAKDMGFSHGASKLQWASYNIKYGSKYLKWLLDRYDNNKFKALDAYNRGPGNQEKYPFKKSWSKHKYVTKILSYLKEKKFRCR